MHLDYTKVIILILWWRNFQLEYWRTFQLVSTFQVSIDRYKAAIGGEQGLDMNFKYHISILKSPLPFKAGVNISGNLDKMKIRVGKAKYKDDVTPAAIHKVDSTRMDLGRRIVERFHRIVGVR